MHCRRSWGPLGILVTTEIQPLETRSASQSVSVVNFSFWQFVITQTYLSMLCTLRWGIFIFFAGTPHLTTAREARNSTTCWSPHVTTSCKVSSKAKPCPGFISDTGAAGNALHRYNSVRGSQVGIAASLYPAPLMILCCLLQAG